MTTTHQDRLDAVTAAIVKAVPEIVEEHEFCSEHTGRGVNLVNRDINLEDVLRAYATVPKVTKIVVDEVGRFWDLNTVKFTNCMWTMGQPLHLQSEELVSFLHSVLCP